MRYQSGQEGTTEFKTRVGVHFNYVWVACFVKHEVISVDLKGESLPHWVNLPADSTHRVSCKILQLWHEVLINVTLYLLSIKELLEVRVTQLVARLILPVIVKFLLNGVIGKMDKSI